MKIICQNQIQNIFAQFVSVHIAVEKPYNLKILSKHF